ncbi:MAG: PAS domain S-box protein [Candidatus Hodarchaeota archaeon]
MEIEKLLERQDIPVDVKKRLKEYFINYRQMEEAQKELEFQMIKTLDSMVDPTHVIDTDLRIIFFNTAFKQWNKELGLEENVIGKTVREVFPFLPDTVIDEYHQVFKQGKTLTTEGSVQLGEKEIFTETRKIPIFERGKVTRIITAIRNITEYRQADKALREAKDKYQMLVEKLEEGVLLEDPNGFISFLNPKLTDLLGYTEEELLRKHWSYIAAVEDLEKFESESAKRPLGISSTYEARALAKDGTHIPVIITATPIFAKNGKLTGVLSVYVDITERKQAEQEIQRAQQQLQDMFDNTPAAVYAKDMKGRYILVNRQWRERTGINNQEVIGKTICNLFPQYYDEIWTENEKQVLRSGEITQFEEIGRTTKRVYLATKFLLRNPDGDAYALCNNSIDITERKHAEEALREAKEKYQMLVEKMEEGVALEDTEGIITFVNPRTAKMLGYTEEELVGEHWSFVVPEEFHEKHRFEESKRSEGISSTYESSLLAKDGTHIPVIISATSIISTTGEFQGVLVVTTDITERKKIEEALRQVKLEEERYHAMLSHFVNNDLQVIINNLEMLMLKFESSQVMDDSIAYRIMDVASRSSKTIDNVNKIFEVLQFPFDHTHREKHNLLASIDEAVSELQSVLSYPCNIIINRESLDKTILGDKYLKDIFYELIMFSQSSKEDNKDEKSAVIIKGCQNPSYFCVSICDSLSLPISEEMSIRLSKTITEEWEYQGHYIGIALASVIMQHYGGSLKILPLDQNGNEFQLYFPINLLQYSKDS